LGAPPAGLPVGIPPYIPHFSMSLEGGQFSCSNFWEIFQKISCYPPKKNKIFCICIGEAPREVNFTLT